MSRVRSSRDVSSEFAIPASSSRGRSRGDSGPRKQYGSSGSGSAAAAGGLRSGSDEPSGPARDSNAADEQQPRIARSPTGAAGAVRRRKTSSTVAVSAHAPRRMHLSSASSDACAPAAQAERAFVCVFCGECYEADSVLATRACPANDAQVFSGAHASARMAAVPLLRRARLHVRFKAQQRRLVRPFSERHLTLPGLALRSDATFTLVCRVRQPRVGTDDDAAASLVRAHSGSWPERVYRSLYGYFRVNLATPAAANANTAASAAASVAHSGSAGASAGEALVASIELHACLSHLLAEQPRGMLIHCGTLLHEGMMLRATGHGGAGRAARSLAAVRLSGLRESLRAYDGPVWSLPPVTPTANESGLRLLAERPSASSASSGSVEPPDGVHTALRAGRVAGGSSDGCDGEDALAWDNGSSGGRKASVGSAGSSSCGDDDDAGYAGDYADFAAAAGSSTARQRRQRRGASSSGSASSTGGNDSGSAYKVEHVAFQPAAESSSVS